MLKVREGNFFRKLKWNLNKNWKEYLVKGLTYLLVALVGAAAVFGVMTARIVKMSQIQAATDKLNAANAKAQELLDQVAAIQQNAQTALDEAVKKEAEVEEKLEQLQTDIEEAKDLENQRWIVPIRFQNVSSPYGTRTHPVSGETLFHSGIDLAAPSGTPIVASRSGTVTKAEHQDQAGNFVTIDHLDGYGSSYLHMSKYIVEVGQFVFAGQVIGYCGDTGVTTGAHLHFEVYHNDKTVNPAKFVDIYG